MSAASISAPMLTTYIQSPERFRSAGEAQRMRTQRMAAPVSQHERHYGGATRHFDGVAPRVRDDQPNPVQLQPKGGNPFSPSVSQNFNAHGEPLSPLRTTGSYKATQRQPSGPTGSASRLRVSSNSRTSAGFPLAMTPQQTAANAERQLEERLAWEAEHHAAVEAARAQDAAEADAKEVARLERESSSTNSAAARAAQQALYNRQLRDPKLPFRERVVPPRPDFPEDPFTALASEHTGVYPGPLSRADPPRVPFVRDEEPAAPEGTPERAEQRRRTNPLLDPLYVSRSDASGLGYGRTHRNHFRYISHWTSSDAARAAVDANAAGHSDAHQLSGFRSKDGRGYRPEVRSLGTGSLHPEYNLYISVRRADDVLADRVGLAPQPKRV